MPRLLTLIDRKKLLHSHHWSRVKKYPAAAGRIPSMRWIDSTWITSAPSCANRPVAGRARPTRREVEDLEPRHGQPAAPAAVAAGRPRARSGPVCSPSAGAGAAAPGGPPLRR